MVVFINIPATVYGQGTYFAAKFSYSARDIYSPIGGDRGFKHIYQVRVLTGEYTQGKEELRDAPSKSSANTAIKFDSVVDDVNNPEIFVIFHDAHAYPEYLIKFIAKKDPVSD